MSSVADAQHEGPWNPGLNSQMPHELLHLCTIFRPENVFTSLATVTELHGLTGLPPSELVAFRPERLLLHELLIRITADFAVPDGSRIGDLGINFREMASRLLAQHLAPHMDAIASTYTESRARLADAVRSALVAVLPGFAAPAQAQAPMPLTPVRRMLAGLTRRRAAAAPVLAHKWGPREIADCECIANTATDAMQRLVYRTVARVMSALFTTNGRAWGTPELIVSLATDITCNADGSEAIGRSIEPLLRRAAPLEGYERLPRQERPVVINTKGPSAAGKSSLRPLQKKLAGEIGVRWADFALISPDIWRKQLLDYGALGAAYKYAGAFTAEELQIIEQKLDRYMARKYACGDMSHLLIDRFRFESVAPDSDEAGSNLMTRFGQKAYLFFVITPPELLVERAWKRGLEFGRYKAVDDTLAHSVEAYVGIPNVFFTWVGHADKRIEFEFLDNSVRFGELPRTVAFGDNDTFNLLDVREILNIERYGRVNVNATAPEFLYADKDRLDPQHNLGFLRRCVDRFRRINFADQATGRIYVRIEPGTPVAIDRHALRAAVAEADTLTAIRMVVPGALADDVTAIEPPQYLMRGPAGGAGLETIGQWGTATPGGST
jgi:hypothetical protein